LLAGLNGIGSSRIFELSQCLIVDTLHAEVSTRGLACCEALSALPRQRCPIFGVSRRSGDRWLIWAGLREVAINKTVVDAMLVIGVIGDAFRCPTFRLAPR